MARRYSPWLDVMLMRPLFDWPVSEAGPYADRIGSVTRRTPVLLEVDGVPPVGVHVYVPAGEGPWPVVVYVHGGGFIAGTAIQMDAYCAAIAQAGYVVVNLEYSLAPRHRHPVPVRQVAAVLAALPRLVGDLGADVSRVALAGDSAGAHISATVAAALTSPPYGDQLGIVTGSALRAVALLCGPYEIRRAEDTLFPGIDTFMWAYTGRRQWYLDERLDELAPASQLTAAFPPTFLTVGDADPFLDQSVLLERRLEAIGVPVETLYWTERGLPHEYQRDLRLPEAQEALEALLAFLGKHLGA